MVHDSLQFVSGLNSATEPCFKLYNRFGTCYSPFVYLMYWLLGQGDVYSSGPVCIRILYLTRGMQVCGNVLCTKWGFIMFRTCSAVVMARKSWKATRGQAFRSPSLSQTDPPKAWLPYQDETWRTELNHDKCKPYRNIKCNGIQG